MPRDLEKNVDFPDQSALQQLHGIKKSIKSLTEQAKPILKILEDLGVSFVNIMPSGHIVMKDNVNGGRFMSKEDTKAADKVVTEELEKSRFTASADESDQDQKTQTQKRIEDIKAAEEAAYEEEVRRNKKKKEEELATEQAIEEEQNRLASLKELEEGEDSVGVAASGPADEKPDIDSKFTGDQDKDPENKDQNPADDFNPGQYGQNYANLLGYLTQQGGGNPKNVQDILGDDFFNRIAQDEASGDKKIIFKSHGMEIHYAGHRGGKLIIQPTREGKLHIGFKGGRFTQQVADDIIRAQKSRGATMLELNGSRSKKLMMWRAAMDQGLMVDEKTFKPSAKQKAEYYNSPSTLEASTAAGAGGGLQQEVTRFLQKLSPLAEDAQKNGDNLTLSKIGMTTNAFYVRDNKGAPTGINPDLPVEQVQKMNQVMDAAPTPLDGLNTILTTMTGQSLEEVEQFIQAQIDGVEKTAPQPTPENEQNIEETAQNPADAAASFGESLPGNAQQPANDEPALADQEVASQDEIVSALQDVRDAKNSYENFDPKRSIKKGIVETTEKYQQKVEQAQNAADQAKDHLEMLDKKLATGDLTKAEIAVVQGAIEKNQNKPFHARNYSSAVQKLGLEPIEFGKKPVKTVAPNEPTKTGPVQKQGGGLKR